MNIGNPHPSLLFRLKLVGGMRQAALGVPHVLLGANAEGIEKDGTITAHGEIPREGKVMQKNQRVADMAVEVLTRQAETRTQQTGVAFEEALKAVLRTEAGRQLEELRKGPHHDERSQEWQDSLARERAEERADAPGWSSSDETTSSPAKVPRRGFR